jgi:hypothetical protein
MASKKPASKRSKRETAAKSAKKMSHKPATRKVSIKKATVSRKRTPARKAGAQKAVAAKAVPCVDGVTAVKAVDACDLKLTGSVHPPDTTLGGLFPTATTLAIFRRCVADSTGVDDFPCGSDNTKQDVEIGLTC